MFNLFKGFSPVQEPIVDDLTYGRRKRKRAKRGKALWKKEANKRRHQFKNSG